MPGGEERGWVGDAKAFGQSAAEGAWSAAVGTAEGLWSLAKGGAKIATDPAARAEAWETAKQVGSAVSEYGQAVVDDPAKAYRDARDGALAAYNAFDAAKTQAALEGRSAEFWGDLTGGGLFTVGSSLLVAGAVGKVGQLAKGAQAVDKAEDLTSLASGVKKIAQTPAMKAADGPVSIVQNCPKKTLADLDALLLKAPAAKKEIDAVADAVAAQFGGTVAKAPIKSKERALEKIMNDYGGNAARIKDLARNTIIVPAGKEQEALAALLRARADIDPKLVKIVDAAKDPLGYSGMNVPVLTKAGLPGEIQINSPAMIFAKEKADVAKALLGDDLYGQIASAPGIPAGGQGHELYELWRSLPEGSADRDAIAAKSRAYYDAFRR